VWVCYVQDLGILDQLGKDDKKYYGAYWRCGHVFFGDTPYSEMSTTTHNSDVNRLLESGEWVGSERHQPPRQQPL